MGFFDKIIDNVSGSNIIKYKNGKTAKIGVRCDVMWIEEKRCIVPEMTRKL